MTERSQNSWQSSNTASTFAAPIVSTVSKGIYTVWCGCKHSITSRIARQEWIQHLPAKADDLEFGLSLPLQPLKGYSNDPTAGSKSLLECRPLVSDSIQITFDYGYKTYSYKLEYNVFRHWRYMALLLDSLEAEGTCCVSMWGETEQMLVSAGDWEARARPGWLLRIYCEDMKDDDVSEGNEEEEVFDGGKGYGDDWWFKRWKTRVEKRKEGREMNRKPWLVGAIAMVAVGISFCTVAWLSFEEDRTVMTG